MFTPILASGKFVGELMFPIRTKAKNLIFMSYKTLKNHRKWARKCIHRDVLLWYKEILPSDLNNFVSNSTEPRF